MKIKPAYKYQLFELRRPVIVYYIVIAVLMIATAVLQKVMDSRGSESSSSGYEMATVIFLFVCGLNAFKQSFHMFMANGVSRRSAYAGTVAALGTVAAGMALIDALLGLVMSAFLRYQTFFEQRYGARYGAAGASFPLVAEGVVWAAFLYLAAAMVGLAITAAYYRMSKPLKLAVSIGVPVLAFIVLPIVDASLFGGAITTAVVRFFSAASTLLGAENPYSAVLYNVFWIAAMAALAWLLMRRATIKTQ